MVKNKSLLPNNLFTVTVTYISATIVYDGLPIKRLLYCFLYHQSTKFYSKIYSGQSHSTPDGNVVATVRVADNTGSVNLKVWNEHAEGLQVESIWTNMFQIFRNRKLVYFFSVS